MHPLKMYRTAAQMPSHRIQVQELTRQGCAIVRLKLRDYNDAIIMVNPKVSLVLYERLAQIPNDYKPGMGLPAHTIYRSGGGLRRRKS